jgi:hypothetical protein
MGIPFILKPHAISAFDLFVRGGSFMMNGTIDEMDTQPLFPRSVERWGVFEVAVHGKTEGNPFVDYTVSGTFAGRNEQVTTAGFYDGNGVYKVRFMPAFEGQYSFVVQGSFCDKPLEGTFTVLPVQQGNHGPVRARGYHFEYDDGTPYYPLGTTCYVWELQSQALWQETIDTLGEGYFNKVRFCVLPKHYLYNLHEPSSYPYEGKPCKFSGDAAGNFYQLMSVQPGNDWNFSRFNPIHFQQVEKSIAALLQLGIEADLILFHPYDRWGFSQMTPGQDELYLRYVLARFSAYRNVWWSLANEYDLLRAKTVQDWERLAGLLVAFDPYHHLRSIHNCMPMYDYSRPWITHCSIQRQDVYKCAEYTGDFRTRYGKPVVLDEIAYEGDIDQGWGNISGQELVRRFWEAAVRGGYATHGETYDREDFVLWWSHGGRLYGESPARIRFLHGILCETPGAGLKQMNGAWDEVAATAEGMGDAGYYLYYYGFNRPCRRTFHMDAAHTYQAQVIDTWEMTVRDAGVHSGRFSVALPRKEYMAIRIRRLD